jgi:hypothetical protein
MMKKRNPNRIAQKMNPQRPKRQMHLLCFFPAERDDAQNATFANSF